MNYEFRTPPQSHGDDIGQKAACRPVSNVVIKQMKILSMHYPRPHFVRGQADRMDGMVAAGELAVPHMKQRGLVLPSCK